MVLELSANEECFACGQKNRIGLKLKFHFEPAADGGEEYVTQFTPQPEHQGYIGITHGGIICTLLDEVMARLAWAQQLNAVTGKLEVRFVKPVPTGEPVTARGRIVQQRERFVNAEATLYLSNGDVAATAQAMLVKVDTE